MFFFTESSWAISLSTAQSALVKLENSDRALLTTKMLLEGVPIHYQSETCAVDRLEDVRSFMVEGNYVRQMVVHHRPRGNDEDDQNKFESLIEYLLVRGPVVASFDVFPSYDEEFTLNMGQVSIIFKHKTVIIMLYNLSLYLKQYK